MDLLHSELRTENLSKFIPTSWSIVGDLWIPVTFSRVCSLSAHEVSVAKRVSQEMGVTWMQCVCKQLAVQGWRDFLLPWELYLAVRILWKALAQEIRWWATRALSAMWGCEGSSVLQFSLQIRVEWYDEHNCICFRIRLEKKVAYLEKGLMDCSMIIKSSCIETTTEQSDKLHEFHDSDVCSTGGKLYTSPVLHCSSPRLFPIEWWMANWFEAILILSACPAYFISIFRYCTQFATCYVHKWISNDLKHAQWFELLPFCSMQQVSAFLSVFSGWRIAKTDATRPWCFVKGLLTQMWRL